MKYLRSLLSVLVLSLVGSATTLLSATPVSAAACTAPSTNYGTVTQSTTLDTAGVYYIWSRIKVPNTTANSYLLEVDGNTCYTVGDATSIAANTWTWVNFQSGTTSNRISKNLTVGTHTFKYIGREDGVGLDKVLLVQDQNCTPTDLGNNCVSSGTTPPPPPPPPGGNPPPPPPPGGNPPPPPPPPPICVGSGCGSTGTGGTVTGTVNLGTTVTGGSGTPTTVKVDGKVVKGTLDSTTLTNGSHTVEVVTTLDDGSESTTKTTVDVNNDLNPYEQFRNLVLKPLVGTSAGALNAIFAGISAGFAALLFGLGAFIKLLIAAR